MLPGPLPARRAHCIFELIYFARPDSEVFGKSVHMARKRMGERLARADTVATDIVTAVPDSGNSAALGYAAASGVPLEMGLTRNHYMGRTFIQPTTAMRQNSVRMKLHPVREAIAGKRVTVIDDSLVRGTTSRQMVKLLRDAGAREVHLRLSSPPLRYPCFFGIDIPTREELISNRLDPDGIAREIGADTVTLPPPRVPAGMRGRIPTISAARASAASTPAPCGMPPWRARREPGQGGPMRSYREAGVDIDRGDRFVDFIRSIRSKSVDAGIGGFSSALPLDVAGHALPRPHDHHRRHGHEAPRGEEAGPLRHHRHRPGGHERQRPRGLRRPARSCSWTTSPAGGSTRRGCTT